MCRSELRDFLLDDLTAKVCVYSFLSNCVYLLYCMLYMADHTHCIIQGVKKIGLSLEMSYTRVRKYCLTCLSRYTHTHSHTDSHTP